MSRHRTQAQIFRHPLRDVLAVVFGTIAVVATSAEARQSCGVATAGDCCSPNSTPACSDASCCAIVCAIDDYCCSIAWDEACVGFAVQNCSECQPGKCGDPKAGPCCSPHTGRGCSIQACCDAVCTIDPFCCNVIWDAQCASEASTLCNGCTTSPCIGDLNGDGMVNGADLTIELSSWGDCPAGEDCPADLNGDDQVNGADLTIMLSAWGACS